MLLPASLLSGGGGGPGDSIGPAAGVLFGLARLTVARLLLNCTCGCVTLWLLLVELLLLTLPPLTNVLTATLSLLLLPGRTFKGVRSGMVPLFPLVLLAVADRPGVLSVGLAGFVVDDPVCAPAAAPASNGPSEAPGTGIESLLPMPTAAGWLCCCCCAFAAAGGCTGSVSFAMYKWLISLSADTTVNWTTVPAWQTPEAHSEGNLASNTCCTAWGTSTTSGV